MRAFAAEGGVFEWTVPSSPQQVDARDRAAVWLMLVAGGCALLVLAVHQAFVMTGRGQLVDAAALQGAQIGRRHIIEAVQQVLNVVSVGALAAAGLAAGAVALLRGRIALAAVAVAVVLGSNVTTQLLKHKVLERPDLALPAAGLSGNTLPSGHTTVAMSVGVAAVLVAPARARGVVAILAAAYGAATGVATLSAGHHRPSDAIAACLVVGAWAAGLGAFVLVAAPAEDSPGEVAGGHPVIGALLGGVSVTLLAGGVLATYIIARSLPGALDQAHLLVAYGGGAALIAGTAFAVIAALVIVVHRVAPRRSHDMGLAGLVGATPSRWARRPGRPAAR